jgi:hypothetical protein
VAFEIVLAKPAIVQEKNRPKTFLRSKNKKINFGREVMGLPLSNENIAQMSSVKDNKTISDFPPEELIMTPSTHKRK